LRAWTRWSRLFSPHSQSWGGDNDGRRELEAALTNAGFVDARVETSERFFLLGHARRP
jgi:hypothetical protein